MIKDEYVRKGIYKGKLYTFSRMNPKTGEWFAEDMPVYKAPPGKWVPGDKIKWRKDK